MLSIYNIYGTEAGTAARMAWNSGFQVLRENEDCWWLAANPQTVKYLAETYDCRIKWSKVKELVGTPWSPDKTKDPAIYVGTTGEWTGTINLAKGPGNLGMVGDGLVVYGTNWNWSCDNLRWYIGVNGSEVHVL